MASIRKSLIVGVQPEAAWAAIRDVGAVHERLARGFVTTTELDDDTRMVTFANGMTVRERIVTIDDAARRLVYTVVGGGRTTHHNASFEVFDDGDGRVRILWTTDLLPDTAAPALEGMMDGGLHAIRQTLEARRTEPAVPPVFDQVRS
jgi:carbon monoxide dehydrogenase subunit G